uniref:Uncharacterized protein n=1 Tax=Arundo donax TaxID=35708 RepID=A0A0A8ZHK8_ARUDO
MRQPHHSLPVRHRPWLLLQSTVRCLMRG